MQTTPEPVLVHDFAREEAEIQARLRELEESKGSHMDEEDFSVHKRKKSILLQREKTILDKRR